MLRSLTVLAVLRLAAADGTVVGNWTLDIKCVKGTAADMCANASNQNLGAMEIKGDGTGSFMWNEVAAFMFQDTEFAGKDHIDATLYAIPGSAAFTTMHLKSTGQGLLAGTFGLAADKCFYKVKGAMARIDGKMLLV
mmetsp:Transcript_76650/g.135242  ORF Transcript_76650/g.135242 Transcript_76650/m.135242 type:complete len:137 (-) Transcript_76650:40-450(-)